MTTHHHHTQEEPAKKPIEPGSEQAFINPYQVLAIPRSASGEDIKKAYFARVREYPPEREPEMFKRIRAAYDALRTPEARAATDLFLPHPPPAYEPSKQKPVFDLEWHAGDRLIVARAISDLNRVDFRDDFRDISL
jgi:curved DNA-binding protein CbpA